MYCPDIPTQHISLLQCESGGGHGGELLTAGLGFVPAAGAL